MKGKKKMKKYPKAFRIYLDRARFHVRGLFYPDFDNDKSDLDKDRERHIMQNYYKCWRAGRKYEKELKNV
jgi:hypothetical protein